MAFRRGGIALTSPSTIVFVISAVLAVLSMLVYFRVVQITIINPRYVYELLLIGYLVLVAGVLFRRI